MEVSGRGQIWPVRSMYCTLVATKTPDMVRNAFRGDFMVINSSLNASEDNRAEVFYLIVVVSFT